MEWLDAAIPTGPHNFHFGILSAYLSPTALESDAQRPANPLLQGSALAPFHPTRHDPQQTLHLPYRDGLRAQSAPLPKRFKHMHPLVLARMRTNQVEEDLARTAVVSLVPRSNGKVVPMGKRALGIIPRS